LSAVRVIFAWITLAAVWMSAQAAMAQDTALTIGVLSFRPVAMAQAQWQPLATYLNNTVPGSHFILKIFNFGELQEAVRQQAVDVVITQPAEYVRMVHQNGLSSPLATLINLDQGKPVRAFGGVILTRKEREDIQTLSDLDGKRVGAVSRISFGAYQVQIYEMAKQHVKPGVVVETGLPQDLTIEALMTGQVDAAFVRTGLMESMIKEGKLDAAQVKVVNSQNYPGYPFALSTRLYPEWPVVAMSHVPDDVTVRIAGALLSLPHGSAIARSMGINGFAVPADYESVRTLMRDLRAPPFDVAPNVTFQDIWSRYKLPIVALAFALGALLLLAARELVLGRRLTSFGDAMGEGMYVLDRNGLATYVNRTTCELLGYPREALLGKDLLKLILSSANTASLGTGQNPMIDPDRRTRSFECESVFISASGCHFPVEVSTQAVLRRGKFLRSVTVFSDISVRKAQSERVYKLAYYDPVTGLPNRRLLLDRLQQSLTARASAHHPGALLFSDLDRFKQLNDSLGHKFGDALLQAAAQRMGHLVGSEGTVAHPGGDEFAVLLGRLDTNPEIAAEQANAIAEKIRIAMQTPFVIDGQHHKISVSIGVVMFEGDENEPEELLKRADIAMYQAKANGRNAIRFFDKTIATQLNRLVALEADLHLALEKGQFLVYYQPQFDTAGRTMGAEALVRWLHPQRGMVSPGEFIPLAEETGLILPLGQWVLEQACAQIREWSESPATAELIVAVNLSAHQIFQSDFVERVSATLKAHGADPLKLQLELTESVLAKNIDDVIEKMNQLVALGITFSLDDFGTGYSSLSYLKRLPLHQLKIDGSFVRDLVTNPSDASITQTILALGSSLELEVIAEGVETQEQRDKLAGQGCLYFQGYLFGRPQPAAQLTQRMNDALEMTPQVRS
jgi:diguanylate cyclase (GGDEF)-like protein/PAS domain S-box-containing protein